MQLQVFFEIIEQCSEDDLRKLQTAIGRVSLEVAALIHNQQTQHECQMWEDLKRILKTKFSTTINFYRAWQEIDCEV